MQFRYKIAVLLLATCVIILKLSCYFLDNQIVSISSNSQVFRALDRNDSILNKNLNLNKALFNTIINPKTLDYFYLLPLNFIISNQLQKLGVDVKSGNEFIQNSLKSGIGLESEITADGKVIWRENGVVFQPYDETKHQDGTFKIPSPYKPQYVEHVPFDKHKFFRMKTDVLLKNSKSYQDYPHLENKIILWYTSPRYWPSLSGLHSLKACPEFPCRITTNISFVNQSSALLFAGQILNEEPPPNRNQVFIFHNHENPTGQFFYRISLKNRQFSSWKSVFNWTMAYRIDSDIPAFYGIVRPHPQPNYQKDYKAILSKKKGLVAWLVSYCKTDSRRDLYVKELQKYIPVSIFGKCGNLTCGSREKDDQCMDEFSNNFKFYLSFESAICEDYITEKLFKYMTLDLITVGRGGNQYSHHVPDDVFINVNNFKLPKDLAAKLIDLDRNDVKYIEMLRKKDSYIQLMEGFPIRSKAGRIRYMVHRHEHVSMCHVCYRLWNLHQYTKQIPDIFEWFKEGKCEKPNTDY